MSTGIYKIVNIVNNQEYIGSAININNRWNWHKSRLNKGKHYNMYLQNAWNKYGHDNFEIQIVEKTDKSKIIEREQYYLDNFRPKYNISEKATGGNLGDEVNKKISLASKNNKANLGRKFSEEHKRKIGESNKGKTLGRKLSQNTRLKMRNSRLNYLSSTKETS